MEEKIISKRKSSWLLKFIKVAISIFLLIVISGVIISLVFGNDIKQLVVREINKQLAVEVSVNGKIEFSVLKNFPYASVTFYEVKIKESYKGSKMNLLETNKIALLFNIIDLWNGNYYINKIIIGKGKLNILINESGEGNYYILKTDNDISGAEVKVKIDEIIFSDMDTRYVDDKHRQFYELQIHEGLINGEFGAEQLNLQVKSTMLCKHLFVLSDDYITNKEVSIQSEMILNLKNEEYDFKNTFINIETFSFSTYGKVKQNKFSTSIDIAIDGNKIGLESFAGLLPESYAKYLKEYNTKGEMILKGLIKGVYSDKMKPAVSFSCMVQNGKISNTANDVDFEQVNFNALFSNGANRNFYSCQFKLKNANATLNGKLIALSLEIKNFVNPYIDVQLNTNLEIAEIYPLFKIKELESASGQLQLNKCFYSGPIRRLNSSADFNNLNSGGEIIITNGKLKFNGINFQSLSTSMKLQKGNLFIEYFKTATATSDFSISGNCTNLLATVFNKSKNKNEIKIGANLIITSNSIDANEFSENKTSATTGESGTTNIAGLLEIITGNVKFDIAHFKYNRFNASNFKGTLVCTGKQLFFNDITMSAEKGTANINAQLDYSNWDQVSLDGTFVGKNIDINQLFYEFNSWGQTEITDKHLKGILTTNLVLKARWNKNNFDYEQLVVVADVDIAKGELNNFEPMKSLSAFVKISELENIRFSHLKNQIEIRNSTINFPVMNIFTNALNMEIAGTHTFENMIDYRVKLNMLQLLSNKFKAKNNFDPDALELSTNGLINLFITMKGSASNPVIKYDKKKVNEKIKQDVLIEKQNLKNILQQEFNKQENNQQEIKDWKAPDEYEIMRFEDSTEMNEMEFDTAEFNSQNKQSITNQKQKEAFSEFKKSLLKKK